MRRIVCEKLARLFVTILFVTCLSYLIVNLLPGDAAYSVAGLGASAEDVEAIRKDLGLDRNVFVRYGKWLLNTAKGDMGLSFRSGEPVRDIFVQRIPVTVKLVIISQIIVLILAVPLGIISALKSESALGKIITTLAFGVMSVPVFVMAIFLIFLFSLKLNWLPATGFVPAVDGFAASLTTLILPGLSIAMVEWVPLMRVLRNDMIATLQEDFILMARSKGLPTRHILIKHALRPSCFTLITLFGIQTGYLIGGAVVVESIFSLPGLGSLMISAIHGRDINIVQGCILFITIAYVLINFIVDIAYSVLDPRVDLHHGRGMDHV
jgi:peptide/nickel transport system permease protein